MPANTCTLLACGDVGPIHDPVDKYATLASATLANADLRFAQVERVYSERGALQVHSGGEHSRVQPHMAAIFDRCGFDVVSVASNHAMDWGADALLDSIELLRRKGIATVGAGRNLRAAREPAVVERNGVRIAFLGYCSVLRDGYTATDEKPGVAPLRAHTYYEPVEYQAGVPPRVVTAPYEEDLAAMVSDIKAARESAHAVVVSLHWGIHYIPRMIADYQTIVARAAFRAGADLILGHHAHVPKAIHVLDGKVCFYSLSNFIMSSTAKSAHSAEVFEKRYGVKLDPDYPYLPYGHDAKRSLIAKAVFSPRGVQKVSFIPLLIDPQLRPEPLRQQDPRFADAIEYMDWASEGFAHAFAIEGDEIVIHAPDSQPRG